MVKDNKIQHKRCNVNQDSFMHYMKGTRGTPFQEHLLVVTSTNSLSDVEKNTYSGIQTSSMFKHYPKCKRHGLWPQWKRLYRPNGNIRITYFIERKQLSLQLINIMLV